MEKQVRYLKDYHILPDALAVETGLIAKLRGLKVMVFLDYDGTLTEIMPHPEEARISEEMRQAIHNLSQVATVCIISGRDKHNIQDLINLPNLFYVGNHGFDIEGPAGSNIHREVGMDTLLIMEKCFRELQTKLIEIPGVQFEPKKLTVTIHYRLVEEKNVGLVFEIMREVVGKYPQLKISTGKKVIEIRPQIEWDKGRAAQWLTEMLGFDQAGADIIYIGDDLSDEDAFKILPTQGIGILVGNHSAQTYASYHLADPEQVKIFLKNLTTAIRRSPH